MFKNYLKITLRNIKRHKGYSFINIVGLAIGIACCILIFLWVRDELSFDMYHKNAKQIYRVGAQFGPTVEDRGAYTPPPLAEALLNEFPEVKYAVRLTVWPVNRLVRFDEKSFLETNIIWADSSIFDVFTIPLIKGNPRTALTRPRNIVITEDISQKYFGNDNPIGKTWNIGNHEDLYEITGVAENCRANSHFQYDLIISDNSRDPDNWGGHSRFTYIVLQKGCLPAELEAKFPNFIKKYKADYIQREYGLSFDEYYADKEKYIGFWLQPLKDIHLNAKIEQILPTRGDRLYIYVFSIIALFILLIACVNFINLSTARSAYRSKEVGIRKVAGSNRLQLIRQFLAESLILSFIALCLSIVIVSFILPAFNHLTNKQLELNLIHHFDILFALLGISVIVGILSGIYPALFLSSFLPATVLKGKFRTNMKSGLFRSGMVVMQFAISIIIVLGTLIIYRQLTYIQTAQLGFDKEHIVVIHRANAVQHQFGAFKQELLSHANIECVSITGTLPGRHFDDNGHRLEGASLSEEYFLFTGYVDVDFARLLNLEMIKGRFFSPGISTDATSSVVINEATARKLGLDHPVGKRFRKEFGGAEEGEFVTIIGVVKDFHFQSLHQKIQPMILRPLIPGEAQFASVKIGGGNIKQTLHSIEKTWKNFTGNQPFEYSFLDDDFNSLYQAEQKLGKIFTVFSILSIVIACSGLFALACYATEQRTKEIGIRKVHGASVLNIIQLVTKEFTKWIVIANVIACPIAWYAFDKWLQNFAYRVNIGIWIFLLSGVLALIVALLTVSYQSIKAAVANPVESLRYE